MPEKSSAGVLVEVLVLGGEEGVDDELRHRLDGQIEPALLGVFGEQRAVGGVDARHHRRLIILQLRVVRQVLGVMPQQARDARRSPTMNRMVPAANRKPRNRSKIFIATPISLRARPAPPRPKAFTRRRATAPRTAGSVAVPAHTPSRHYPLHRVSSLRFLFKLRPVGPGAAVRFAHLIGAGAGDMGGKVGLDRLRDQLPPSGCARCPTTAIASPA